MIPNASPGADSGGTRVPPRVPLGGLERTLKGARAGTGLARAVLPVFQSEDFEKHADYVVKEDQFVAEYVKRDPKYRALLRDTAQEVYAREYKPYLTGSKLIDSWDRITSAAGGLSEVIPGLGQAISAGEEIIELAPKIAYSTAYAVGTGDYAFLPKAAAYEAASFIPIIGDVIDMKNLYVERARKTFRKRVAEEFLKKVSATGRVQ